MGALNPVKPPAQSITTFSLSLSLSLSLPFSVPLSFSLSHHSLPLLSLSILHLLPPPIPPPLSPPTLPLSPPSPLSLRLCSHSLYPTDSGVKKVSAMPGSPVDVKTHSRPAPSAMPPLPSINPSGPRPASFSSTARECTTCLPLSLSLSLSRSLSLPLLHHY